MQPGKALMPILQKIYEPSSTIWLQFKKHDLALKTDEDGNPVMLFIGKAGPEGRIKGKRFVRTLKKDAAGRIIKDHWELKGKST